MKTKHPSQAPGNRPGLTVWRNPDPIVGYVSDLKKYNELLELHSRKRQELNEIAQQMNVYAQRVDRRALELPQILNQYGKN